MYQSLNPPSFTGIFSVNIMFPTNGFFIAISIGWKMTAVSAREELLLNDGWLFLTWRSLLRYLVPLVTIVIMLGNF
jgi:SNF family Na+-dependent transporter